MTQPDYRSRRLAFLVALTLGRTKSSAPSAPPTPGWFEREADTVAWLVVEECISRLGQRRRLSCAPWSR
jgi:hypothetical protein